MTYRISFWSNIKELRYKVGKLTENYEEKILRHCDLDLWPKVTKFNRVRARAVSNHLAKIASKSLHPFDWNFVHKKCQTQTDTHTAKRPSSPAGLAGRSAEQACKLVMIRKNIEDFLQSMYLKVLLLRKDLGLYPKTKHACNDVKAVTP